MDGKQGNSRTRQIPESFQAQLELTRSCCDLGLKCCNGLAELNAEMTQKTIAMAEAGRELLSENSFPKFMANSTEISIALWSAWWSTGVEFQKSMLGSLAKR
ncbi:hypothetical protein GPA22_20375 [Aromatoleum toluvorans]|uniref:Phasin protein n=1 Tax=Aromatoleum toluvorans TaxID=92002 RepID=A0ABX1Q2Y8_9RHOO|nr:hypothetical protein [Aromatoleum toluvorans]NMG46079.1 hypothetical protein [Aromatoleum toluvorans]